MSFEARVALVLAERQVDFPAHNALIVKQRVQVEAAVLPIARRIGLLVEEFHGLMPLAVLDELARRLTTALDRTARFGFNSARREVRLLRADREHQVRAAYVLPDAGAYPELATQGMEGVRTHVRRRSRQASTAIAEAATTAAAKPGLDRTARRLLIADAARRATHNYVLELVGETLNMGRTAGALSLAPPPQFAMRSEQLDQATCEVCEQLHGQIEEIGSSAYYQMLPPSECLGGGRCRGIMVFGDGPVDLRQPEEEAA